MKTNVGSIDRLIRLLLASVLLYFGLLIHGGTALGIGLSIAGSLSFVTGLIGFCGLYKLFGICTKQPNEQL